MSDRELLELAAKAAGIEIGWIDPVWNNPEAAPYIHLPRGELWNPLTDDGDALRLAVKLRISLMLAETPPGNPEVIYCLTHHTGFEWRTAKALHGDPYAAARRAIVRTAAEIGRSMT